MAVHRGLPDTFDKAVVPVENEFESHCSSSIAGYQPVTIITAGHCLSDFGSGGLTMTLPIRVQGRNRVVRLSSVYVFLNNDLLSSSAFSSLRDDMDQLKKTKSKISELRFQEAVERSRKSIWDNMLSSHKLEEEILENEDKFAELMRSRHWNDVVQSGDLAVVIFDNVDDAEDLAALQEQYGKVSINTKEVMTGTPARVVGLSSTKSMSIGNDPFGIRRYSSIKISQVDEMEGKLVSFGSHEFYPLDMMNSLLAFNGQGIQSNKDGSVTVRVVNGSLVYSPPENEEKSEIEKLFPPGTHGSVVPGDSGGAVMNNDNQLIAVITARKLTLLDQAPHDGWPDMNGKYPVSENIFVDLSNPRVIDFLKNAQASGADLSLVE